MQNLFDEIRDLTIKGDRSLSDGLSKLMEEIGELATEVNKISGIKSKGKLTDQKIKKLILSEAADSIQNILSILAHEKVNIECYDLVRQLKKSNNKWNRKYIRKKK